MTASISTDPTLRSSTKHSPEPKKVELSNAHCVRAYELNKSKNFAGALKEVQLAKYLTPDEKPPFEIAFAVYNDMQDWNNGIANLMEVIRIKPDDVMAHVNLGALKTKIGVLDGAVSILIKATQLDPKHANSHLSLGTAYLMQGNYKLALDSLTNSINLDPSVPVAYLHRASVKEKLKDYVAAIPDFEKYCELGGSPEVPDLAPLREHIKDLRRDYELLSPAAIQLEKRKQKMQKEIDERNLELEQLKRDTAQQVDSLQKEREKLGFLAISKKKDIDQRIISLENRLSDFSTTVESLRKQLTELKL
jgi:tetratricopeptide (TPR) repeat protein